MSSMITKIPKIKIESRKFCCCLPVRLGVFVLSLLAMVGGSIIAAVGWMTVASLKNNPVELSDEIALYVHSSIFTLLGVLAVFGFVGSLVKSRGSIIAFSVGLAIHLGLSIASGVFTIYSLFKENPQSAIDACLQGQTDADAQQICKTGMSIVRGAVVAIYIIAWLLELYAYFIVDRYADQLEDEEFAKLAPIIPNQFNQGPPPPMMYYNGGYNGYPQRFSYSAYAESRRSYVEPRRPAREDEQDGYPEQRGRPRSEYAFTLPQQAYGVSRGKDAGNGM